MLFLLLRVQQRRLVNALAQAWSAAPVGFPTLVLSAAALLIYEGASTYASLKACPGCAAELRAHATLSWAIWLAACILIGIAAGASITAHLRAMANAAWLAPLPWSDHARRRAIRLASATHGAALAGMSGAVSWAACHGTGLPRAPLLAASSAFALALAYAAAARCTLIARTPRRTRARARSGTSRAFDQLDRLRPAHAGRWAMAGRARLIGAAWLISLLAAVPAAAAASLAQHQAGSALAIAVIGGNAIFILALRCAPLQSAALRVTPLIYAHAAAAMCRIPLVLSLAWFACTAALPLAGQPAGRSILPAMIAGLLLLNALYAAAAIARPGAPAQAILLHAAGLYAIGYETATAGLPYGALTLLAVSALAALLVRHARARYRAWHG